MRCLCTCTGLFCSARALLQAAQMRECISIRATDKKCMSWPSSRRAEFFAVYFSEEIHGSVGADSRGLFSYCYAWFLSLTITFIGSTATVGLNLCKGGWILVM